MGIILKSPKHVKIDRFWLSLPLSFTVSFSLVSGFHALLSSWYSEHLKPEVTVFLLEQLVILAVLHF